MYETAQGEARRRRVGAGRFAAIAAIASIAVAAPAQAQSIDPTTGQYGSTLTQIETGGNPPEGAPPDEGRTTESVPDTTAATPRSPGSLPFTGLDVVAMTLAALALAGAGLALRGRADREEARQGTE